MIPWLEAHQLSKTRFIKTYFSHLSEDKDVPSDILLGVVYKQTPRPHTSTLTLISFDQNTEDNKDFLSNIFGSKASLPWATDEGRVILWVELR